MILNKQSIWFGFSLHDFDSYLDPAIFFVVLEDPRIPRCFFFGFFWAKGFGWSLVVFDKLRGEIVDKPMLQKMVFLDHAFMCGPDSIHSISLRIGINRDGPLAVKVKVKKGACCSRQENVITYPQESKNKWWFTTELPLFRLKGPRNKRSRPW